MCTTISRSHGRPFSPGGCPVPVGNTICGETQTLNIINEFKRLYEGKMQEIDNSNCGDCLQEKLKLQQDWIGDLSEQNEMLVRAVEELEMEATERVKMLEDKLQQSAACICEVMKKYRENDATNCLLEEPRKRIFNLENDIKNLLEFLRRIREEHQWNAGGLVFYEIAAKEFFGAKSETDIFNGTNKEYYTDTAKERSRVREQDSTIRELETRIMGTDCLTKELEAKKEECESLQKDMMDMRQALTEEVATKHDAILKLKRECQELEERCIRADKQTAFRDDIIKELRKEIKQLKQQITQDEVSRLNRTITVLGTTLEHGKILHEEEERDTVAEINCLATKIKDCEKCICKLNQEIQEKESEIVRLNNTIKELENCICNQNQQLQCRNAEIHTLNNNIRELDTCICGLNDQLKVRFEENFALKTKFADLEQCCKEVELNSKTHEDVDVLRNKIKGLECCINDLQSKSKLCKICKQSIRVTFRGNTEVQTDAPEPTEEQLQLLLDRDELIRYQSNTLEAMQQELHSLHEREKEFSMKVETSCKDKQILQNKIAILEDQLEQARKKADLVTRKEEIIKKQKEAINLMQQETALLRGKEAEMLSENEKCCTCIQQLKNKINELETAVQESERRANNLQMAVDLYTNTINVLEASEEKYKLEIDHQRTTINNLQDALVTTKQEMEEFKQKYDDSVSPGWSSWFGLTEHKPANNQKPQKPVHDI